MKRTIASFRLSAESTLRSTLTTLWFECVRPILQLFLFFNILNLAYQIRTLKKWVSFFSLKRFWIRVTKHAKRTLKQWFLVFWSPSHFLCVCCTPPSTFLTSVTSSLSVVLSKSEIKERDRDRDQRDREEEGRREVEMAVCEEIVCGKREKFRILQRKLKTQKIWILYNPSVREWRFSSKFQIFFKFH